MTHYQWPKLLQSRFKIQINIVMIILLNWVEINKSLISAIRNSFFVPWNSKRSVVHCNWDYSFSSDDVYDCFILPHEILHLLLDVRIMLQQILKMLPAVCEILLQSSILTGVILIHAIDFIDLYLHLTEILASIRDNFLYSF